MKIIKTVTSADNTKKYYFSVLDSSDAHIEACLLKLIRYGYIICVSSQIGCSQKCKFCASGKSKLVRNLTALEIQRQIQLIMEDNLFLQNEIIQVTYMGSGEPLNNYKNVFESIDMVRDNYPNISKVNISTTCPQISRKCFEDIDWRKYCDFVHFQYSLHFTKDEERNRFLYYNLMKISEVIESLNRVSRLLNDTYKINYIPFDNLNDNEKCVEELKEIMHTTENAVLKISEMCKIEGCSLLPSKSFEIFSTQVKKCIENVEIFRSDGMDVNAGCGQFYNESIL